MKVPNGIHEINLYYGNPDPNNTGKVDPTWLANNIVKFSLPTKWKMFIAWGNQDKITSFSLHKKCVDSLNAVLEDVWNFARIRAKDKYGYDHDTAFYDEKTNEELKLAGLHLFGGSFNFRLKRGGNTLSMHSWGCAIDLDPANNSLGDTTPKMSLWVVEIFEEHGWVWGGRWKGKNTDGMHYQFASGY